jgi:hypothetical protein
VLPDPGPLPPPPGGDPQARDVVLGRRDPESVVKKADDGTLRVGPAVINKERTEMLVPGRINQRSGIIEYLAVGPKGKVHESVLVLDLEATHLMVGCLLLGLTPAPLREQEDPGLRVVRDREQADPAPPERELNSLVDLLVRWKGEDGKPVEIRAEELTWNRERKGSMARTAWVFTGSMIYRGNFVAELEQSYIGTWPDRSAIFNSPIPSKNPYRGAAFGFEANRRVIPALGTPIEFVVRKATP